MSRTYTLKKRADQQAETRQRITEAALDLHTQFGPAETTISMIAERAGVQRHTVYAHFPDERSLFQACSGLHLERDPLPDPSAWRVVSDPAKRLTVGLSALYGWFARNAQLSAHVTRDAEHHALTREINDQRYVPVFDACDRILGEGLSAEQRPLLRVALSFYTWQTLAKQAGLDTDAAVATMARAIFCGRG